MAGHVSWLARQKHLAHFWDAARTRRLLGVSTLTSNRRRSRPTVAPSGRRPQLARAPPGGKGSLRAGNRSSCPVPSASAGEVLCDRASRFECRRRGGFATRPYLTTAADLDLFYDVVPCCQETREVCPSAVAIGPRLVQDGEVQRVVVYRFFCLEGILSGEKNARDDDGVRGVIWTRREGEILRGP